MSQDKIDIKDVTPKTYNPKTHKGNQDRFNPSNRIYVRESKGTFQKLRRYGSWFLLLLFGLTPWIPYGNRQAILLDIQPAIQFFWYYVIPTRLNPTCSSLYDCSIRSLFYHHFFRPSLVWISMPANGMDLHVYLVRRKVRGFCE